MSTFRFGHGGRLYIGTTALTGRPPATGVVHYNNATWRLYDNVRDVEFGGTGTNVDITTRDEARSGFQSNVTVFSSGELTFESRWRPSTSFVSPADEIFQDLIKAWIQKLEVAIMDLDQPKEQEGAQGFVGNFIIDVTRRAPVGGIFTVQIRATLSSFPNWIIAQDSTGTNFASV